MFPDRPSALAPTFLKGGRSLAAFLAAVAAVLAFLAAQAASAADEDSSGFIGIDMKPSVASASAASAGVDTCAQVKAGDEFDADVVIVNAEDLVAWELRVQYDPKVVSLESADYNWFLTKDGGSVFPSLFEQEKDGRMFLAAADASSPDSGSGILARLHLRALKNGTSSLSITTNPSYFGPRLVAAGGTPFGDLDGDGIWDGTLTGASVAVGRSCAPSTPVVTPRPVVPSPTPGQGPSDGSEDDGGGVGGNAGGEDVSVPVVIDLFGGPGDDGPSGVGANNNSDKSGGSGDGQPGDDPAEDTVDDPEDGDTVNAPQSAVGDDSGPSVTVLAILGALAALAIIAGVALMFLRPRLH